MAASFWTTLALRVASYFLHYFDSRAARVSQFFYITRQKAYYYFTRTLSRGGDYQLMTQNRTEIPKTEIAMSETEYFDPKFGITETEMLGLDNLN